MSHQLNQVLQRKRDRERLAALLPGGSRERPIIVSSAAVIEPRAVRTPCLHCGGEYRIHEHERAASSVRRVDVGCRQCSAPRSIWFRLVPHELN
ncbi:MAG: hypothetical protein H0T42_08460 [Deltaproteobacteria bacterium]|nr:hypothetical protein [Deltaproteobacteria bacterium]